MCTYETRSDLQEATGSHQIDASRTTHHHSNSVASARQKDSGEVSFFGLTLHPKSLPELTALVEQGILGSKKWIITNHNLHSDTCFTVGLNYANFMEEQTGRLSTECPWWHWVDSMATSWNVNIG
jgi:hypothetical protein